MAVFKAPQYTKLTNPKTGKQEPCYTFSIDWNTCDACDTLSFVAETQTDISLQSLQKCILDNIPWWNNFIQQFLQTSSKYFSKSYTVEQINKITQHTLDTNDSNIFPINVILVPKSIKISAGIFTVNWVCNMEPMIDFPDVEDVETVEDITNKIVEVNTLPVSKDILEGLEELNIDEIPVGTNSTDTALELDSPAKFYEKRRVKEARLKAKLAVYKAQRQMAQYYDKYGDDISDSDTDFETSEDDSEKEEVQL
jgi:hypothetical protein